VAWAGILPLLYYACVYKWKHLKESQFTLIIYLENLSMGIGTLLYGACRLTRIYKPAAKLKVRNTLQLQVCSLCPNSVQLLSDHSSWVKMSDFHIVPYVLLSKNMTQFLSAIRGMFYQN
jgi:hypothetical protein